MTTKTTFKKISSRVRKLRRNGANALECSLLFRVANLLFEEGNFLGARMARKLEEEAWRLDGLSRFPVGSVPLAQLSCARSFTKYKGYLVGTIPNVDGIKFHRLTGRWPTAKDGRKYQPIVDG